jgi:rod shape-determining protein MreC
VLRTNRTTSTVLLVVDRESVVGARLGSNLELGFLRGRGPAGEGARLDLDLVDDAAAPAPDDVVVTWGSRSGAPYVAGIPIGRVRAVSSSPRQLSAHAVVEPFVDFTSLDLVGVVVAADAHSDRGVIKADGTTRGGSR